MVIFEIHESITVGELRFIEFSLVQIGKIPIFMILHYVA